MKQKINSNAVHDVWRHKRAAHLAKKQLPADWLPHIAREAKDAAWVEGMHPSGVPRMYRVNADIAAREVYMAWIGEYGGAAAAELTDGEIKAKAAEYAYEAEQLDIGRITAGQVNGAWGELVRLLDFCQHREVDPPKVFLLASMGARVRCKYWWRRALRRMVARRSERGAMSLGLVSKQAKLCQQQSRVSPDRSKQAQPAGHGKHGPRERRRPTRHTGRLSRPLGIEQVNTARRTHDAH
jgi:hypothetical protein